MVVLEPNSFVQLSVVAKNGTTQTLVFDQRPLHEQVEGACEACRIQATASLEASGTYVLTQGLGASAPVIRHTGQLLATLPSTRLGLASVAELVQERLATLHAAVMMRSTADVSQSLRGILAMIYRDDRFGEEVLRVEGLRHIWQATVCSRQATEAAMACFCELARYDDMRAIEWLDENSEEMDLITPEFFQCLLATLFTQQSDTSEAENENVTLKSATLAPPRSTLLACILLLHVLDGELVGAAAHGAGLMGDPWRAEIGGVEAVDTEPRRNLYSSMVAMLTAEDVDEFQTSAAWSVLGAIATAVADDSRLKSQFEKEVKKASTERDSVDEILKADKTHRQGTLVKDLLLVACSSSVEIAARGGDEEEAGELLVGRVQFLQESLRRTKAELRRRHRQMCKLVEFVHVEGWPFLEKSLPEVVRLGWDSMQFERNYSLLHYCAQCVDDPDVVELIAVLVSNANEPDDTGQTPLDYAKQHNTKEVVRTIEKFRGGRKRGGRGSVLMPGDTMPATDEGQGGAKEGAWGKAASEEVSTDVQLGAARSIPQAATEATEEAPTQAAQPKSQAVLTAEPPLVPPPEVAEQTARTPRAAKRAAQSPQLVRVSPWTARQTTPPVVCAEGSQLAPNAEPADEEPQRQGAGEVEATRPGEEDQGVDSSANRPDSTSSPTKVPPSSESSTRVAHGAPSQTGKQPAQQAVTGEDSSSSTCQVAPQLSALDGDEILSSHPSQQRAPEVNRPNSSTGAVTQDDLTANSPFQGSPVSGTQSGSTAAASGQSIHKEGESGAPESGSHSSEIHRSKLDASEALEADSSIQMDDANGANLRALPSRVTQPGSGPAAVIEEVVAVPPPQGAVSNAAPTGPSVRASGQPTSGEPAGAHTAAGQQMQSTSSALPLPAEGLDVRDTMATMQPELRRACEAVLSRGWGNIQVKNNFTSLHLAAKLGSHGAVQVLLMASAMPGLSLRDGRGLRPIDYAAERGYDQQMLELLDPELNSMPVLPDEMQDPDELMADEPHGEAFGDAHPEHSGRLMPWRVFTRIVAAVQGRGGTVVVSEDSQAEQWSVVRTSRTDNGTPTESQRASSIDDDSKSSKTAAAEVQPTTERKADASVPEAEPEIRQPGATPVEQKGDHVVADKEQPATPSKGHNHISNRSPVVAAVGAASPTDLKGLPEPLPEPDSEAMPALSPRQLLNTQAEKLAPLDDAAIRKYLRQYGSFGRAAVASKLAESEISGGLELDSEEVQQAMSQLDRIMDFVQVVTLRSSDAADGARRMSSEDQTIHSPSKAFNRQESGGAEAQSPSKGGGKASKKGGGPSAAKGGKSKDSKDNDSKEAAAPPESKGGKKGSPPPPKGKGGAPPAPAPKGKGESADQAEGKGPAPKGKGGPPAPPGPAKGAPAKGKAKGAGKAAGGGTEAAKPKIVPAAPMKPVWWNKLQMHVHIHPGETVWDKVGDDLGLLPVEDLVRRFSKTAVAPKQQARDANKEEKKEEVKLLRIITDPSLVVGREASLKAAPPAETLVQAIEDLDSHTISVDMLRMIRENACPDAAQLHQIGELVRENPSVPLALPEHYMWAVGRMPAYRERIECWSFVRGYKERHLPLLGSLQDLEAIFQCFLNSEALPALLGVVLAVGNYLNGGTSRGQADGFDLESIGKLDSVKDASGKDIRSFIFEVLFTKMADKAAALVEELSPCLSNVSRRLNKDSDGVEKLSKSVRLVLEDFDQCVAMLHDDLVSSHATMQMVLQYFDDPADEFRLKMPGWYAKAKEDIDALVSVRDRVKDLYAGVLKWFKINAMKSSELCMLWDNFFVPSDLVMNVPEKVKKEFMVPVFCQSKPITAEDLQVLWGLKEVDSGGSKSGSGSSRPKRQPRRQLTDRRTSQDARAAAR